MKLIIQEEVDIQHEMALGFLGGDFDTLLEHFGCILVLTKCITQVIDLLKDPLLVTQRP